MLTAFLTTLGEMTRILMFMVLGFGLAVLVGGIFLLQTQHFVDGRLKCINIYAIIYKLNYLFV